MARRVYLCPNKRRLALLPGTRRLAVGTAGVDPPCLCVPSVPTGACCLSGGTCEVGTADQCVYHRGQYQGDGTTCAGRICTGACCISGTECLDIGFGPCILNFAPTAWKGIGTTCSLTTCPGQCCDVPGTPCYWTAGGALSQTLIEYSVSTTFTRDICCGGVKTACSFTRSTSGVLTLARTGCVDGTFNFNGQIGLPNTLPSCSPTPCGAFSTTSFYSFQLAKTGQTWQFFQELNPGGGYTNNCNFVTVYNGCTPTFTRTCTETSSNVGSCGGSPMADSIVSSWTVRFTQGILPCGTAPRPMPPLIVGGTDGSSPVVLPSVEEVMAVNPKMTRDRAESLLGLNGIRPELITTAKVPSGCSGCGGGYLSGGALL